MLCPFWKKLINLEEKLGSFIYKWHQADLLELIYIFRVSLYLDLGIVADDTIWVLEILMFIKEYLDIKEDIPFFPWKCTVGTVQDSYSPSSLI